MGASVGATVLNVVNAAAESVHSKIQWIEKQACGHCDRTRLRGAHEVHLGGPDLYPAARSATHRTYPGSHPISGPALSALDKAFWGAARGSFGRGATAGEGRC